MKKLTLSLAVIAILAGCVHTQPTTLQVIVWEHPDYTPIKNQEQRAITVTAAQNIEAECSAYAYEKLGTFNAPSSQTVAQGWYGAKAVSQSTVALSVARSEYRKAHIATIRGCAISKGWKIKEEITVRNIAEFEILEKTGAYIYSIK